jgi:hypothetical protein
MGQFVSDSCLAPQGAGEGVDGVWEIGHGRASSAYGG